MSAPSIALPSDSDDHVVEVPRLVRLCRRYKPEGRDFRLVPQRVCWSGDTIDVCSVCGMDVYDRAWQNHHSEEMLEMVEPNAKIRDAGERAAPPL